jgi:hypothetical protein
MKTQKIDEERWNEDKSILRGILVLRLEIRTPKTKNQKHLEAEVFFSPVDCILKLIECTAC